MVRFPLVLALVAIPAVARGQQPSHSHQHPRGAAGAAIGQGLALDTTRWTLADVEAFLVPAPAAPARGGTAVEQHGPVHGGVAGAGATDDHAGHATSDDAAHSAGMVSATSGDGSMGRDGTGTAWLPETSPMEAFHGAEAGWELMLHGAAFLRFTAQDVFDSGSRGQQAFGLPNWVMAMAQRRLGPAGVLTAKTMLSLDPITEGGNGYPLLFQSGETFQEERLVDRQHPHDLFSELSLTYTHRIAAGASVFGHVGYPGEPALGPVAFVHRPSSRFMADSPLAHHWQDATHIVFGVATLGTVIGPVKVDASVFTGSEPDEERFGFDAPKFDSYAGRVSYSPSPHLALQVSRGFLREPEALEPGVDQWRTTASALFSAPFGRDGDLSGSLIWGANDLRPAAVTDHAAGVQHALLVEGAIRVGPQTAFGRAEYTQKSAEELALEGEEFHDGVFDILSMSLGAGRDVYSAGGLTAMLGAQASIYGVPETLRPVYGSSPVSLQVFLRLSPSRMIHGAGGTHAGM